jgi:hypothetical protein
MEKSTMLLMEQSTISMAIFNSFLYVYQMVSQISSQFTQLGKQLSLEMGDQLWKVQPLYAT